MAVVVYLFPPYTPFVAYRKETSMFVIPQLLVALAASPAVPPAQSHTHARAPESCIAPEHTGTFRLTASRVDGTQGIPAVLLLENIDGCLAATLITDGSNPAAIDRLAQSGETLQGRLNVTGAEGRVTLRFDGSAFAGSIVARRQEWKLTGRKTS